MRIKFGWFYWNSREQKRKDLFAGRLAKLREQIVASNARSDMDKLAYDRYMKNHPVETMTARGYPEWEGSDAQRLCRQDIDDGTIGNFDRPLKFHASRDEYKLFPLKVFRDHIYQIIRTKKYMHQLQLKGKGYIWKDYRDRADPDDSSISSAEEVASSDDSSLSVDSDPETAPRDDEEEESDSGSPSSSSNSSTSS